VGVDWGHACPHMPRMTKSLISVNYFYNFF
jgi:hypothetical protein